MKSVRPVLEDYGPALVVLAVILSILEAFGIIK